MSTADHHLTLKQSYIQRVYDFRKLFIQNQNAQDGLSTLPAAMMLSADLLSDYGNVGNIAEVFQDAMQDEEFSWGMFGAFTRSLVIDHEGLDTLLEQVHLDHSGFYPKPLLATGSGKKSMVTYYHTSIRLHEDHQKPALWDASGAMLHNPVHFMTPFSSLIQEQIFHFFNEDGEALKRINKSLTSMAPQARDGIVEKLLTLVTQNHLPLDDPRRLAIVPFTPLKHEASLRLKNLMMWLSGTKLSNNKRTIDQFFSVFKLLDVFEKEEMFNQVEDELRQEFNEPASWVEPADAVKSYAYFLQHICWEGFPARRIFSELFDLPTKNKHEVFTRAIAEIPARSSANFAETSKREVVCAAFLMIQPDESLLASNLSGEALLSLYILKGNEKFKTALQTPENVEHLFLHELGL